MKRKLLRIFGIVFIFLMLGYALSPVSAAPKEKNNLEVHFIDVGQGDSTLIICDGKAMLIDAGNNNKGTAVQLYLQKQGIKDLEYVIGTHPDADHIGGLDVVIYKFNCSTIIMPDLKKDTRTYDDVIQTAKNKRYKIIQPVVGTTYELGSAQFTIIAPNSKKYDADNNYSVGILLEHENNRFLFAGDAEEESELEMLNNKMDLSADVYKVSHHGSKTSSVKEFVETVNPTYGVISCSENNAYYHPAAQTLNTLRGLGVKLFRTDEQGSIVATSDGKEITWNCAPTETWKAGDGPTANTAPATITYVLNTKSHKFHYPTCRILPVIHRQNTAQSRADVVDDGYTPCGNCKP